MAVRLIVTGGTFDKEYDEIEGRLYFKETHVHEMLKRGRCRLDVVVDALMLVDSLDLTDADRKLLLERCRDAEEDQIVITHGTDTMVKTAQVLGQARLSKTVVLTGAMIPWAFGSSDGLFNLGSALSFAQSLPHGAYVAMNGRWFPWDDVTKKKSLGIFEPRSSPSR